MDLTSYSHSAYSLLPPAIALVMAILTRRVLISLACGIVVGAALLKQFMVVGGIEYLLDLAKHLVCSDDSWNSWNINILLFLLLLGSMTGLMQVNGSTVAFANWARQRINTHRGASLLTALLCFVVFIDDYFHSLAVGSITRPVTDHAKISRAKLAYLLDSTAAPMCVIMPISSWGAYIIALIGGILAAHGMADISPLNAFINIIPLNFYALFALIMAFSVAYFNINIAGMAKHEQQASLGHLFDEHKGIPAGTSTGFKATVTGTPWGLILPLLILALATFCAFLLTGYQALPDGTSVTIFSLLKNTDVAFSLVIGGFAGLIASVIFSCSLKVTLGCLSYTILRGAQSMLGAIWVLLFAWSIATVIRDIHTGTYLASQVKAIALPPALLPMILFIIAGVMAFATGTSWGTFGVMLPIAGDIVATSYPEMMYPVLAAVLAGSVFGDHCSPISDTTILSSTGAGCHHIDHVMTQLPYALLTAFISAIAYLVIGYTGSLWMAISAGLILLCIGLVWFNQRPKVSTLAASA
ncbi:Na+/H+ antiporter NhaC family protein [Celerinatantimonas yamalensis]|uniref:Na+/H+ antiporter NhaC family protein n=1 Tax=Celerinatantimonas yamalensis TaxID=559956 RepID=A0ABW9G2D6_9GAMM